MLQTARNRAGQSLVDIAALHEHGSRPVVLRLTPKTRAFLHAAFRHNGLDGPGSSQPSSGIVVMRGVSHAPQLEVPRTTARLVETFAARLER